MPVCRRFPAALLVAVIAAAPAAAQPGGQITAGNAAMNARYSQSSGPTGETVAGPQSTSFGASFDPAGLYGTEALLNWWFYRVQGDTRERPFGTYTKSDGFTIAGTSNWPAGGLGSTASYHWTENGAAGVRFTADYTLALVAGTTVYDGARLDQTFRINNPNSQPLTIALFDLARWSPAGNDFGLTATGGVTGITVSHGSAPLDTHTAVGANAFQVGQALTFLVDSSVNDLNNTGLPYSGDNFLDAFEWNLTIPANGSLSVQSSLITAVPEPSALILTGAAAAIGLARVLRRSRPALPIYGRTPSTL